MSRGFCVSKKRLRRFFEKGGRTGCGPQSTFFTYTPPVARGQSGDRPLWIDGGHLSLGGAEASLAPSSLRSRRAISAAVAAERTSAAGCALPMARNRKEYTV